MICERQSGKHPTKRISERQANAGFGVALICLLLCCPGAAPGQTNNIPATINLVNLNPAPGKVCALGNSLQGKGGSPGPYYLAKSQGLGVWLPITGTTTQVSALQVGADITAIQTSPNNNPQSFLNSGRIRFFIIETASGTQCSDLFFTVANTTTGALNVVTYPFPQAIFELSLYPVPAPPQAPTNYVATVDITNVDSFEAPLMMRFWNPLTLGVVGNPVYSRATRGTMITGPNGIGGQESPFVTWLQGQPNSGVNPNVFAGLALSSSPTPPGHLYYPYAMLQAPNDYLEATCTKSVFTKLLVPTNCTLSGAILHWSDPLASFFDGQLTTFFNTSGLVIMGDAQGVFVQQPWTAISNTANCPVYLIPDGKSMKLTPQIGGLPGAEIIICNPVGQVVTFAGEPTGFIPQIDSITVGINQQQCVDFQKYTGWLFGQPESGFVGIASEFVCTGRPYIKLTNAINYPPNQQFSLWVFSNINVLKYPSVKWFESASQMVFAGNGAFSDFASAYLPGGDLQTVALSVGRNIAAAFSRGVANCNNVTMANPQGVCKNFQKTPIAFPNASDAFWANEANWFPANGVQDYYAQYLHTARLDTFGNIVPGACVPPGRVCFNTFLIPNNLIPNGFATSNQGIPMGMAYGFGYDEVSGYATNPPNVPSKLDPIPQAWGTGVNMALIIGRSQTGQAAHDFNGDGISDILIQSTGGGIGMWLMNNKAMVGSVLGVGSTTNVWTIVGQRDLNGDGKADLLFRANDGSIAEWLMDGATILHQAGLGNPGTAWTVVGTGDFSGDGIGDILLRGGGTAVAICYMNILGAIVPPCASVGSLPSDWVVFGTGDFNGDGVWDILWFNNTGAGVAIWLMNANGTLKQNVPVGSVPAGWSLAGTGDFDGDGISDILLSGVPGSGSTPVAIWFMSPSGTLASSQGVNVAMASGWTIAQTGDFNLDGKSDILWYNSSNAAIVAWLLNGATFTGQSSIGSLPASWMLVTANSE